MSTEDNAGTAAAIGARTIGAGALIKGSLIGLAIFFTLILIGVPLMAGGVMAGGDDTGAPAPCEPGDDCDFEVTGDAIELATILRDSGRLSDLPGGYDHLAQVYALIPGDPARLLWPNCQVDIRVLQLLVKLISRYDHVAVSSINRKCSGELLGAGVYSAHYINGGGHAIDLYALSGVSVTGNDTQSRELLTWTDGFIPAGSRTGQRQCRAAAPLVLSTYGQFADGCNHIHIDFTGAPEPTS